MQLKVIRPWSKDFSKATKLYLETFPSEERVPILKMIALITLRSTTKFLGFYEHNSLCGFALTVCSKRYLYINFIATDPDYRSLGYGTSILNLLKRRFRKPIIALVKLPGYDSPEYEDDLRRIRFWQKAGADFFHFNYTFSDPNGGIFAVGIIDGDYDRDAFKEILDLRSFHPAAILRNLKRQLLGQPPK